MRIALVLTMVFSLGACGNNETPTGDAGPGPGADAMKADASFAPGTYPFFQRLLDAQRCAELNVCGGAGGLSACLAAHPSRLDVVQARIDAGKVVFNSAVGDDCLSFDLQMGCSLSERTAGQQHLNQACLDALEGQVADGDACIEDEDCHSDHCRPAAGCGDACCMGTCLPSAPLLAPIGASCDPGACVDAAFCKDGTCTARIAAGEPCSGTFDCVPGFVCGPGATDVPPRTCVAVGADQAACDPEQVFPCDQDDERCDPGTHLCTRRLEPGAACTVDAECLSLAPCKDHTCTPLPGPGEPCLDGSRCAGVLVCGGDGRCAAPPQVVCP